MQKILIEKPYQFVPPFHSGWRQKIILSFLDRYLWKNYGLASHELRHIDRLKKSTADGHGVIVAVNHSRPCDPMACGWIRRAIGRPMYCMASWHLFEQTYAQRWLIRSCGGFSVHREGSDTAAVNFTVRSLTKPDRPVVIFPEGAISRANDIVQPMLEGTTLIARLAARQRAKRKPIGKVVIHPVALKYFFRGDMEQTVVPVLERIERRLAWQTLTHLPVLQRLRKLGNALLCLRELEYLEALPALGDTEPQLHDRIDRLIETIISRLEAEWTPGEANEVSNYARVQRIRSRIMPDLVAGKVDETERVRRWRQLTDAYVAMQLACYPRNYLSEEPSAERIIETVERLDEDLTDEPAIHGPWHLVIEIGEAIEVEPKRPNRERRDPLIELVRSSVAEMIAGIKSNPPS